MAPDADKLRNRVQFNDVDDDDDVLTSTNGPLQNVTPLKDLKGTEVAIDGIVYDIADFADRHPGGRSILLFGGNDVTVQYKMIHPRHAGSGMDRHLEKMKRVGTVPNYQNGYKFDTEFEREMKREIFKIVKPGKDWGTSGFYFRAVFYISLMFSLQFCWSFYLGPSFALAIIFGMSQASIGLNVQHDANHGAASKKAWVNDLLGFGADLIGGCKWLWMEQHWTHHAYTNHNEKDADSFSPDPIFSFNDYPLNDERRRWWHKYQAIYFIPLLATYWLSEVFNPQITDLRQRGSTGVGMSFENEFVVKRRKYAIMLRMNYIFLNVIRPIMMGGFNKATIGQILLLGVSESLTLALLFALSHNFEGVDRDPTESYRETGKPVCWFKSQVETSSTYGGFVAGCLTGGLNFQVEHHLFPRMSSAWYPYIAPKVREICKKHGVKYAYYPYVWLNFVSLVKYMHSAGTGANWDDLVQPLSGKN